TISLFIRGPRGDLLHRRRDVDTWGELRSFGVPLARVRGSQVPVPVDWPLAACSTGPEEIQLLARGAEGELLHGTLRGNEWDGSAWSPFASLGSPQEPDCVYPAVRRAAPISSAPAGCGGGTTRLDVFARGPRGDLLHSWWDGQEWNVFESLGMPRSPSTGAWIPFTGIS